MGVCRLAHFVVNILRNCEFSLDLGFSSGTDGASPAGDSKPTLRQVVRNQEYIVCDHRLSATWIQITFDIDLQAQRIACDLRMNFRRLVFHQLEADRAKPYRCELRTQETHTCPQD